MSKRLRDRMARLEIRYGAAVKPEVPREDVERELQADIARAERESSLLSVRALVRLGAAASFAPGGLPDWSAVAAHLAASGWRGDELPAILPELKTIKPRGKPISVVAAHPPRPVDPEAWLDRYANDGASLPEVFARGS
jgi:hypothetical protein